MRLFLIIASFIIISSANSQYTIPSKIISESEIQYPAKDNLDIEALYFCVYPEDVSVDLKKWVAFLNDSLELDDASIDTIPVGRYTVLVQFAVGENGRLTNISITQDPGYGLGQRVINVLSNCQGIWKPLIHKGRPILSYRRQPIVFTVEEECEDLPADVIL